MIRVERRPLAHVAGVRVQSCAVAGVPVARILRTCPGGSPGAAGEGVPLARVAGRLDRAALDIPAGDVRPGGGESGSRRIGFPVIVHLRLPGGVVMCGAGAPPEGCTSDWARITCVECWFYLSLPAGPSLPVHFRYPGDAAAVCGATDPKSRYAFNRANWEVYDCLACADAFRHREPCAPCGGSGHCHCLPADATNCTDADEDCADCGGSGECNQCWGMGDNSDPRAFGAAAAEREREYVRWLHAPGPKRFIGPVPPALRAWLARRSAPVITA